MDDSLCPGFPSSSLLVDWERSQPQPKALRPCIPVGDLAKASASWLLFGSYLAFLAACGMNQRMEELDASVSAFIRKTVLSLQ